MSFSEFRSGGTKKKKIYVHISNVCTAYKLNKSEYYVVRSLGEMKFIADLCTLARGPIVGTYIVYFGSLSASRNIYLVIEESLRR